MKKLILCLLFLVVCAFNQVIAQDAAVMPTDEEIRQTIEKFNFDDAQKEFLFKETKKKLEQMYKNGEIDLKGLDSETIDYQNDNQINPQNQKPQTKTKKYSNHDPLTKKQKLGPQR